METQQTGKEHIDFNLDDFGGDEKAALTARYIATLEPFTVGAIVPGKVIEKRTGMALVDIGYKSEGLVPEDEFTDYEAVEVGEEVEVLIEDLEDEDGMLRVSKRQAEIQRSWDRVLSNFQEGDVIEGRLKSRVRGGLIVDIGVDGFLPGSQLDVVPVRGNLDEYMDKPLDFKILKIDRERRNIVLSRRELLEDRRREEKKTLLAEIKPGQTRRGVVKNITDFGAFIDLSGMDGLLHITDMSWGRINHPSEMVSVGQELEVMVLDVNLERERISLGLKQQQSNPWDAIGTRYPVGSRIKGRVVNLMPYGAFVEIEEGVEGLVHVSEMSWTKRIAKASDVLEPNQEVECMVLNISEGDRKISLGMRQCEANPWELVAERYPIGAAVTGTVRNFTSYGAFVQLQEGVDGMIHVSDMSWTRKVNHPSEVLQKGEEVKCVVLEVDAANQRISLGLKQAQEDPWASIGAKYPVGKRITGKIAKLAAFGAFIELDDGIDGLIHISQISDERVENVRDALKVGDEVDARVVKIDPVERRIGLSIKAAKLTDEEFKVDESMLSGLAPSDDLVDLAGAFNEALGSGSAEWHPGDRKNEEGGKDA